MNCERSGRFSRLKSGLGPLVTNVSTRRIELGKIERNIEDKTAELAQVQQKIDASSKLLK